MSYIGNTPLTEQAGAIYTQQFSGNGSTIDFVLNDAPAFVNNLAVYINGLYQQKSTFSLVNNHLIFSEAPPVGIANIEVVISETLPTSTILSAPNTTFLIENDSVVNQNYSINVGKNAVSAGPITINPGVTVEVPAGSTWVIV